MKLKDPLLFIDTNILLDFYRNRGDAGITLLEKVDRILERVVTTYQVEMEFKKNRQNVISSCFSDLKEDGAKLSPPGFLSNAKTLEIIKRQRTDNSKRVKNLKERITKVLANPKTNDPVYKTCQRMFSYESPFNLKRSNSDKKKFRSLAWKRFILGYPPRKKNDTSTGDAINWEWIVDCLNRSNRDIIIVSRDADYGVTVDGSSYINDWLLEELKDRTKQSRKILLFDRLTAALKRIDIEVTKAEEEAEAATARKRVTTEVDPHLNLDELSDEEIEELWQLLHNS